MNTLSDILRLAGGNVPKAIHAIFDGHQNIQECVEYWGDFEPDHVAFTPQGWEINRNLVWEAEPLARIVVAAEAVLADNTGDLDTDTRSGAWLIGQDKLRTLRDALKATWIAEVLK